MTVRRRPPPRGERAPATPPSPPPPPTDATDLAGAALLGAALTIPDALDRLRALGVQADEFRGAQKVVWHALERLGDSVVDVVTVAAALDAGQLAALGGPAYLTGLAAQASPAEALAEHHAALRRALQHRRVSQGLRTLARVHSESPQDLLAALSNLTTLAAQPTSDRPLTGVAVGELARTVVNRIRDPQPTASLIPTGLPALDAELTVLPGHLVVLAGRPAMGKSLMGLWVALQAAKTGIPALVISLEMAASELAMRALASEARCDVTGVMRAAHGAQHDLGERGLQRLDGAVKRLDGLPLHINDRLQTLEQIVLAISHAAATGIRLVVVDHLHCILADDGRNGETVVLGRITARLKETARRHGVAIWLLAQLSRAVEYRSDHRPVLSDLRQSGEIEAYADTVLMAYRDEYYHPLTTDAGILELLIAKQRHGTVATIRAGWDGSCQRLIPI